MKRLQLYNINTFIPLVICDWTWLNFELSFEEKNKNKISVVMEEVWLL